MIRVLLLLPLLLLATCDREKRESRAIPTPVEDPEQRLRLTSLRPDGAPAPAPAVGRRYERNASHVSQGGRYFVWFNCAGCHANGGGGMGPPLMDANWIYGGEIDQIAASILQGRPNGMPSFRGRIPDEQVWQIAAYVRSLPRHIAKDVAPGRRDQMQAHDAPQSMERVGVVTGDGARSVAQPQ
jgi:cytochrome c oxidase cbb3-type subunit 3